MNYDTDFPHGNNSTGTVENCGGTVECRACGKYHGWCDELTALRNLQGEKMLPEPGTPQQQQSTGRSRRTKTDNVWLNVEFVSSLGVVAEGPGADAKCLAVKYEPHPKEKFGKQPGPQVVVKLAIGGQTKFWNLDIANNPNYKYLCEQFGKDENDWPGQKFQIGLEQHEFYDNLLLRAMFDKKEKEKGGQRK